MKQKLQREIYLELLILLLISKLKKILIILVEVIGMYKSLSIHTIETERVMNVLRSHYGMFHRFSIYMLNTKLKLMLNDDLIVTT